MKTANLTALQMGLFLGTLSERETIKFSDIPIELHEDLFEYFAARKLEKEDCDSVHKTYFSEWLFKIYNNGFDYPIQWASEPQNEPKQ